MATIKIPDAPVISYTVVIADFLTQSEIRAFDLPYAPAVGDDVRCKGRNWKVTSREWDLDEPNPETKPFVTVYVAPSERPE